MYRPGDLIVYGGEGVCRVESVGPLELSDMKSNRLYYTLSPLNQTGTVFAPVEGKAFMRPVMSRSEADALVRSFSHVEPTDLSGRSARAMGEYYQSLLDRHENESLVLLIRTIAAKQERAIAAGRKSCQMDERYRRRAEDALYGELAIVLELDRKEVEGYIRAAAEEQAAAAV